jgi:hypothetical protein
MRRSWAERGRIWVLLAGFVAAPLLPGCGGGGTQTAVSTPEEIPEAPKEASKASYQALSGGMAKKAAPAPGAPK